MESLDLIFSAPEAQLVPLPEDVVAVCHEYADGGNDDGRIALRANDERLLRWDGHGTEL